MQSEPSSGIKLTAYSCICWLFHRIYYDARNHKHKIICFVDLHPCIISQINATRCTILFNIFIYFSSLHVSGIHVPISRRKLLYPCYTVMCHSVWVASGLLVLQTRRHSHRVTNNSVAWIQ